MKLELVCLVVSLALLVGCAHEATDSEVENSASGWTRCIIRSVYELDDGVSDPVSIAYGVRAGCQAFVPEYQAALLTRFHTNVGKMWVITHIQDQLLQTATHAVIRIRSDVRKGIWPGHNNQAH
jgi:hypothetical protein